MTLRTRRLKKAPESYFEHQFIYYISLFNAYYWKQKHFKELVAFY